MFVMVKWSLSGSDDYHHEGFVIGAAASLKDVQKSINEKVSEEFENGYAEIYYGDNSFTTLENESELLESLSVNEITESEFNTLKRLVGQSYGQVKSFMKF